MVRCDLQAARASWIGEAANESERADRERSDFLSFRDNAGHVFDFHALRHQFISNLAASGAHPKVAQSLARHSTIALTMDSYTHLGLVDLTAALDKLPGLPVATAERERLRATGTDGEHVPQHVPAGDSFRREPALIGKPKDSQRDRVSRFGTDSVQVDNSAAQISNPPVAGSSPAGRIIRTASIRFLQASSPGVEPGLRPSQGRVQVRHTPRTTRVKS